MERYTKEINGKKVTKSRKEIVLYKDGTTTLFPTHEMLIADGWVKVIPPTPTAEELLYEAKQSAKLRVGRYDASPAVNEFFIGGESVWLDKATRAGLKLRIEAEMASGVENTTLWYGNKQYTLPLSHATQMLYAIERYASACYDNTQAHYANIEALTSIEEVEAYDYTTSYPEKLRF